MHLGNNVTKKRAESILARVEEILSTLTMGGSISQDDAKWLKSSPDIRIKLEALGIIEPTGDAPTKLVPTVSEHLKKYLETHGPAKKPGTVAVWRQVVDNLNEILPKGIRLDEVTVGHAKLFHESIRKKGMATTTIHKRIGFARQFFNDAVDWEIISKNPFSKVKTSTPSTKSNVFVDRDTITHLMKFANPTWQVIIALSRFGGLRCPSEVLSLKWCHVDLPNKVMLIPEPKVEHHEGRGVRKCPIFSDLLPYLQDAWDRRSEEEPDEYVVDKPAYRAAANTGDGWKDANMRTQFLKIVDKAGLPPWKRSFHSMRASCQTELEKQFPTHVVCAWLGNSIRVARKNYLLVTDEDFQRATGEGVSRFERGTKPSQNGRKRGTKPTLQGAAPSGAESHKTNENTGKVSFLLRIPIDGQRRRQDSNLKAGSTGNYWGFDENTVSSVGAAVQNRRATRFFTIEDEDLLDLVELWPNLTEATQEAILTLAHATRETRRKPR
jgi:integrase